MVLGVLLRELHNVNSTIMGILDFFFFVGINYIRRDFQIVG